MSEINVTGITGASVGSTTGIIGGTIAIGSYTVNDYVITITQTEGDYGYTMTITKGNETQTVTLYGLTSEQYSSMLGYLEQALTAATDARTAAQEALNAAQSASTSEGKASDYAAQALSSASVATQKGAAAAESASAAATSASSASTDATSARRYAQDANTSKNRAAASQTAAETAKTSAETAAETAATSASQAAQSATDAAGSASAAAQTLTQVQAEGAAQIAAIDAEGREVLDSIPADYTALEGEVTELKSDLGELDEKIDSVSGLSDEAKIALLACFENVAWANASGQTYYDALNSALYAGRYPKITASFNSGTNIIYTDDILDSLKQYLTVTYFETESSTGVVLATTAYTLSGTLKEGTSKIIVTYDTLTTSFVINGVVDFYNIWSWNWTQIDDGGLDWVEGSPGIGNNLSPNRIVINQNATMSANRRTIAVDRGVSPLYQLQSKEALPYYPIPIPMSANKVNISISPNTKYLICDIIFYRETDQKYYYNKSIGAVVGNIEETFDQHGNDRSYILLGSKQSAPDTTYVEDVTGLSITFEEV